MPFTDSLNSIISNVSDNFSKVWQSTHPPSVTVPKTTSTVPTQPGTTRGVFGDFFLGSGGTILLLVAAGLLLIALFFRRRR